MIVVDFVVVAALLGALVIGVRRGLLENLGVIVGFLLGGAAAFWFVPVLVTVLPLGGRRALATAVFAIALLVAGTVLGAIAGHLLHCGVERTPLRSAERALGGVVTVVVAALVLSFTASTVALTGSPSLTAAVGSSRVLGVIDGLTPAPLEAGMSQLRAALLDDGLPRFTQLLEPEAVAPPAALDLGDPELSAASASVAMVSGTAFACGASVTGTGFVIAPGRVLTNAHVVAGVTTPVVRVPGDDPRQGEVVLFDPVDDLAVIAVDGLEAAPLVLSDDLDTGAAAVVQGYPYGGPFTSAAAQVLSLDSVIVPDIYGGSSSPREIYTLQTDVRPGDSGGPLLTGEGTVAGIIFARGEDGAAHGYATAGVLLRPIAAQASSLTEPVGTSTCVD